MIRSNIFIYKQSNNIKARIPQKDIKILRIILDQED